MYRRTLRYGDHVRRFTVRSLPSGWEITDEQDFRILRNRVSSDWHRVERAMLIFGVEATRLLDVGWVESL